MSSAVQQLKHLMNLPRESRRIRVAQYLKPLFPTNKSLKRKVKQETNYLECHSYCCVRIAKSMGLDTHTTHSTHMHHQPTNKLSTNP